MAAPFNKKKKKCNYAPKKGEKLSSSFQIKKKKRTDLEAVEICVEDVSTLDVGD